MRKKEECYLSTYRHKRWIVFFFLLCSIAVGAQKYQKAQPAKTRTTQTAHPARTTQNKKSVTTKRPPATVKKPPTTIQKPPVDVRNEPEWLKEQQVQPDSLQMTLLTVPKTVPTKVDSILKAHSNSKLARRIDSLIHTPESRERIFGHLQKIVRFDSMMTARYARINTDKNYVIRPPERITFKISVSSLGTSLGTEGQLIDGTKVKTRLTADFKNSMNFSATYRGISIGGSLDPTRIFRKNEDVEFNLVNYGNRFGMDAVFQRANSFSGHATINGQRLDIPGGNVHQTMLAGNMYYVFNYRKFSYAAAFSQSFIQRRSAGSLLVGLSFVSRKTKNDIEMSKSSDGQEGSLADMEKMILRSTNLGIGAGYGINWVPHRRWMIHLSSLPTIMVFNYGKREVGGEGKKIPFRFPEVIITGRSAIIYSFHNMFIGGSAVVTDSSFGSSKDLKVSTLRWQTQIFWGTRLWK